MDKKDMIAISKIFEVKIQIRYLERLILLFIAFSFYTTYYLSITIFSPFFSGASKDIYYITFSTIACSLLAPMFSVC